MAGNFPFFGACLLSSSFFNSDPFLMAYTASSPEDPSESEPSPSSFFPPSVSSSLAFSVSVFSPLFVSSFSPSFLLVVCDDCWVSDSGLSVTLTLYLISSSSLAESSFVLVYTNEEEEEKGQRSVQQGPSAGGGYSEEVGLRFVMFRVDPNEAQRLVRGKLGHHALKERNIQDQSHIAV